MVNWWNGLIGLEEFFAVIAIPSTIILFLQTILSIFSFGGDGDIDIHDGDTLAEISDASLRMFTVRGFIAFFSVFGWSGLVMLKNQLPVGISIMLAIIFGLFSMAFVAYAFMLFMKLQSNGALNVNNAIGTSGTVYISIPENRKGKGKISALVSGRLTEFDAVTDEDLQISSQKEVTVVAITGENTLVVTSKCQENGDESKWESKQLF